MSLTFLIFVIYCEAAQMNHTPQSIGLETVNSAYDNILLNNAQPIGPETVNPDNILPGKKAMISPQTIGLSTVNTPMTIF
jgi:hypothetical protein